MTKPCHKETKHKPWDWAEMSLALIVFNVGEHSN